MQYPNQRTTTGFVRQRRRRKRVDMDFGLLPPEVNSARMYAGPGAATLLAASAKWEELAAEMQTAADRYASIIAELTGGVWIGPSSAAMRAAVLPYVVWVRSTAEQCEETAGRATAAAAAYELAFAMTVPPSLIAANRARLTALIASNIFGQNTPAIMLTEAEYGHMWAQDTAAMYGYAANSVAATTLSAFTPPSRSTNPDAADTASTVQGSSTTTTRSVLAALQQLARPGHGTGLPPAIGSHAPLASSGAASCATLLSRLADSGKGAGKRAGDGMEATLQLITRAVPGMPGTGSGSASEIGSSAVGFGSDGFGLSTDISGFALDLAGSGLELAGGDSLLDAEEAVPGEALDPSNPLAGLGSLGWDGQPAAGLGHASQLGTLSVPPSWSTALPNTSTHHHGPGAAAPNSQAASPPAGGMLGRGATGSARRVGAHASLIPRSPMAG